MRVRPRVVFVGLVAVDWCGSGVLFSVLLLDE